MPAKHDFGLWLADLGIDLDLDHDLFNLIYT